MLQLHIKMPGRLRSRWIWIGATSLGILISSAAAEEAKLKTYGKHLAQECTSCHRADGSDNGIPSIVGWPAETLVATMKFYQQGTRTNPVMVSVANSLNDQQLAALAAFFAALPKPAKDGPAKK